MGNRTGSSPVLRTRIFGLKSFDVWTEFLYSALLTYIYNFRKQQRLPHCSIFYMMYNKLYDEIFANQTMQIRFIAAEQFIALNNKTKCFLALRSIACCIQKLITLNLFFRYTIR